MHLICLLLLWFCLGALLFRVLVAVSETMAEENSHHTTASKQKRKLSSSPLPVSRGSWCAQSRPGAPPTTMSSESDARARTRSFRWFGDGIERPRKRTTSPRTCRPSSLVVALWAQRFVGTSFRRLSCWSIQRAETTRKALSQQHQHLFL